jgi:hypothetical protein
MRGFVRDNSLSLAFGAMFLVAVVFQAIAGQDTFNEEQLDHHGEEVGFWRYVASSQFAAALLENWQSEYLQFTLYILLTVWLIQRGSPESKEPGKAGTESEEEQKIGRHAEEGSPHWARVGGLRTAIYSNSLLIVMGVIWIGSWFAQSVTGWSTNNAERIEHEEAPLSWLEYVGSASFWENTLQNWQSEFLAVGSVVIFTVYLRQRGSAQSKPVGAAHSETAVEG